MFYKIKHFQQINYIHFSSLAQWMKLFIYMEDSMIFSVIFLEIFYGTIHKEPYYIKKSRLNSGIF